MLSVINRLEWNDMHTHTHTHVVQNGIKKARLADFRRHTKGGSKKEAHQIIKGKNVDYWMTASLVKQISITNLGETRSNIVETL